MAKTEGAALRVIRGTRVCYRTIGHGVFHCRQCGGDRPYRLRSGRRFGTVAAIPVMPSGKVDDHVQCRACQTRYHTSALSVPTARQMQAALPAGMRAAASVMLRSGDPCSRPSRGKAIDAITEAGARGYDQRRLDRDLAQPGTTAIAALNQVGRQLAVQAKEWFLAEVVRIGVADGPLSDAQRLAAQAVAFGLGMTHAQAYGVISMAERAAATD